MNLPPFLRPTHESFPYGVNRFYIEQGPITPFWSLYIPKNDPKDPLKPEKEQDRRAVITRVKTVSGYKPFQCR